MKKIALLFAFILTFSFGKVKAAEQDAATLTMTQSSSTVSFSVGNTSRNGYIYFAQLSSSGQGSRPALCMNRGLRASSGANYITDGSPYAATTVMRKAYNFLQQNGSGTMNYIVAQIAVWLEQEGNYSVDNLKRASVSAYLSYYSRLGYNFTNNDISYANSLSEQLNQTASYNGNLYIYTYKHSSSGYQTFLSSLKMTPGKYVCPTDSSIDITDCMKQNATQSDPEAFCVKKLCPETASCGYKLGVNVNNPVCADDNANHSGSVQEYTIYTCGDNDSQISKHGRFTGQMGTYCKMYCLESVEESFPGGISTGITLGTSLVWPTSSSTANSVWGNRFPLTFQGTRSCKIEVLRDKKDESIIIPYRDYQLATQSMQNNRTSNGYNTALWSQDAVDQTNYNKLIGTDGSPGTYRVYRNHAEKLKNDAYKAMNDYAKSSEYTEAQAAYNRCINGPRQYIENSACGCSPGRMTYNGCSKWNRCWIPTCSSESTDKSNADRKMRSYQDDYNRKNAEYVKWKTIVQTAENYKKAYQTAQQILTDMKQCVEWSVGAGDVYQFTSGMSMSYNDPEYGTTHTLQENGGTSYSITGGGSTRTLEIDPRKVTVDVFADAIDYVEKRKIDVFADASYKLPDGLYRYVNKKTQKSLMNPTGDYITIGYSNLPTSYNAEIGKDYELRLYINSLGHAGNLTQYVLNTNYACHYSVTNLPTDECVCPEGTVHAGEDIYGKLVSSNGMTCADAQVQYCDKQDPIGPSGDNKYCPNNPSIKLTACLNRGYTYNYCVNKLCNINEDFECPRNTPNWHMDIKPCVFAMMSEGYTKNEAVAYCESVVCPYKGGLNIIYRPISLRNPFPGKSATGLANGMFSLDNIKGRFPGANWNSVTLVKNEILWNRKTEGDSVYEKEPLYTFILNGSTIRDIRAYNEKQENSGGYADFTLECKKGGTACLSNQFLRNSNSGLVSGTCKTASGNAFYTCAES